MAKKLVIVFILSYLISSCTNDAEIKLKVDSVGKKFDSAAEKLYDSTKVKAKVFKEKIIDKINQKDSIR